jgi:hypothetical protein
MTSEQKRKREYYLSNRDLIKKRSRKWAKANPEKSVESTRRYQLSERGRANRKLYRLNKQKRDPLYRLRENLRRRLRHALTRLRVTKNCRTMDIVGCDLDFLKQYLEARFTVGMTWGNYGLWHIDHVIPLAKALTDEDIKKLCHYTNLSPLWAEDNRRKGSKLVWPSCRIKKSHRTTTKLR